MRFTIVDNDLSIDEEYEWGTCELCATVGTAKFPRIKVKWENGESQWIDLFYDVEYDGVSWLEIDNVFDFAGWLREQPDDYFDKCEPGSLSVDNIYHMNQDYSKK